MTQPRDYFQDLMDAHERLQEKYDQFVEDFGDVIELDNSLLKDALKSQITLSLKVNELHSRAVYVEMAVSEEVDFCYAYAYSELSENSNKKMSATELKNFASIDDDYIETRKLLTEVRQLKNQIEGIRDTIISRKYVLNNITNSVVADSANYII